MEFDFSKSALHTAYWTFHTAHWTLDTAQFIVPKAQCTLHTVHCTLKTAHCTLHTTHCILHTAHYLLHTAHCTQHILSPQNIIHSDTAHYKKLTLSTEHSTLHSATSIFYPLYAEYTSHCAFYICLSNTTALHPPDFLFPLPTEAQTWVVLLWQDRVNMMCQDRSVTMEVYFHQIGPLGRFDLVVAMSVVCLYVCPLPMRYFSV